MQNNGLHLPEWAIWALGGVWSAATGVAAFFVRRSYTEQDEAREMLERTRDATAKARGKIDLVDQRLAVAETRINAHADELRKIAVTNATIATKLENIESDTGEINRKLDRLADRQNGHGGN